MNPEAMFGLVLYVFVGVAIAGMLWWMVRDGRPPQQTRNVGDDLQRPNEETIRA